MSDYKILVVEDELLVAADIEESLQLLGYDVVGCVATGKDAIASVEKNLPDIILMDIMLKGDMTGIEAAKAITQKHDVPIIYLTANADIATIDKAKLSLPYGYIIKPFTEKDLQTNIEIARFKFNNDLKARMESDQYNRFFTKVNREEEKHLFVEGDKGLEKINTNDIYFVESENEKVNIHLPGDEIQVNKTIDGISKILPQEKFIQVNKNQIVNIDKIFLVKFPEIIIADTMTVIEVDKDKQDLVASKTQKN
jgi:DNA-binding LytR/AlgR family response regulator